jgi:hypothetical protein
MEANKTYNIREDVSDNRNIFLLTLKDLPSGKSQSIEIPYEELVIKFKSFNNIFLANHFQECYKLSLKNLIKKNRFLELYQQLLTEQISEQEFQDELSKNEDKYIIKYIEDLSPVKARCYLSILDDLKYEMQDLSVLDISEIFSIQPELLDKLQITNG